MHQANRRSRILVVDDVPVNVAMLGEAFAADYEVLVATSGERALELAVRSPQPDLILLDILMPGMSGLEVCRRLRDDLQTHHIPLMFITSKGEQADEEKGLSLGAADYIVKPFHLPIVKARVRTQLELKRKTDLLEELAARDGLTGLPNRRAFDERLDQEWRRARRSCTSLGLIMLDVDEFKRYNDHYGHRPGDDCLRAVSGCIAGALQRASDFAARYGGEEFVVLLPGASIQEINHVAERIRQCVERRAILHAVSQTAPVVTVSLGTTHCWPRDSAGSQVCVEAADQMLYEAKRRGRNRVCDGQSV